MNPSWRKPFGMLVILSIITAWVVLVVSLLEGPVGRLPALLQAPIYVVAGLVWIWIAPLKPLLRWMETGRWRS